MRKRHSLSSPVEKVKVPELEPDPLPRLPDELVSTVQGLRVGSRVGRGKQFLATVPEKRETAVEHSEENDFLENKRDFHLPRNLFP